MAIRLGKLIILAGLAAATLMQTAAAQLSGIATRSFAPEVIESQIELSDHVGLRARAEVIRLESPQPAGITDRQRSDLEFKNLGTFVDVRPFQNSFVISGGLYTGDKTRNEKTPAVGSTVTGETSSDQSGSLQMAVKGDDYAPFLGVGFDSTYRRERRWGVKLMAGAVFSGTPDIALTSPGGPLSGDAVMLDQLERERALYEDTLEEKAVHPVVQVGLTYRF